MSNLLHLGISLLVISAAFGQTFAEAKPTPTQSSAVFWPPVLNQQYPDIELMSSSGKKVKLSSFKGKVIFLEPIGMSCPACQAFAGAGSCGGLNGVSAQPGLPSADSLLSQRGIAAQDPALVRVQLLLYGPNMGVPSLKDGQDWAKHFDFTNRPNEILLIADARFQNQYSFNMIPGFQLIDKNFVLRCDSTGHNPKNDLYRDLLPMLKSMLNCRV